MPFFYSFFAYSSSFSSPRLGSSMAEGVVISILCLIYSKPTPAQGLFTLSGHLNGIFAHFTQASDCGIENFHKHPRRLAGEKE